MAKYQFVFFLFFSLTCFSQFNLFEFDYRLAPIANSSVDNYITSFKLNIPTKHKKGVLINSLTFESFQFNYSSLDFDYEALNTLYKINYTATYLYPLSEKWKLRGFAGLSLASNLKETLSTDDFLINGGLIGIKDLSKDGLKATLSFGLTYSALIGRPKLIPIVRYFKELNSQWSYIVGFPITNLVYNVDDMNLVKAYLGIKNIYANLSEPSIVNNDQKVNKASFITGDLGCVYEHKLSSFWTMTGTVGYSFYNNYELLNNHNKVYDFKLNPAPFFSLGLKLNVNK